MRAVVSCLGTACAVALSLLAGSGPARAEYPERNIDLIIPYAPGGGFDIYARAVANAMVKYLGKDVKIIPKNVPGGAAIKGITTLYIAPPDGYTFGIVPLPGGVQPQLVGRKVAYDLDKITWLGVVNIGVYSLVVASNSQFKTLDDVLKGKPRVPFIATTGSNDDAMARIVMSVLKGNAKYLSTFRGGPETHLAVIRGEADVSLGIGEAIAPHLASGEMRQLVWFQHKGTPGAPVNVPTAEDIGHPELANLGLYRVLAAPPGLDPAVRRKLVDAVQSAMKDKDFLEWSRKANYPVDPGTPDDAKRLYTQQKAFLSKYVNLLHN